MVQEKQIICGESNVTFNSNANNKENSLESKEKTEYVNKLNLRKRHREMTPPHMKTKKQIGDQDESFDKNDNKMSSQKGKKIRKSQNSEKSVAKTNVKDENPKNAVAKKRSFTESTKSESNKSEGKRRKSISEVHNKTSNDQLKKSKGSTGYFQSPKKSLAAADNEKTDWKQFRKEKKELRTKRKQSKNFYEISLDIKKFYEQLKRRKTENKDKIADKIYALVSEEDILPKLVMAHDSSRVVQAMLKYGNVDLKQKIAEKLLPLTAEMSVSKYANFAVLRIFQNCSMPIKSKLVDKLMGHIVKLSTNSISSKIICHSYLNIANDKQKAEMRQEFYDNIYRKHKDPEISKLIDTFQKFPERKNFILSNLKANLVRIANKQIFDNSLVHAVLDEYIEQCDVEKLDEFVPIIAPMIAQILTTKNGRNAAINCFNKSSTKNRRAIIKSLKENLIKTCTHAQGHIFIIAVINCLDDTKAIKKVIFDTIYPELKSLMSNKYGRHIIEWLVAPANTKFFHPTAVALIDSGLQYSKKDKEVRRSEILSQIEDPLANAIADSPEFFLKNRHIALTTGIIINKLKEDNFEKAATALASVIAQPNWLVSTNDESESAQSEEKGIEEIIAESKKLKKARKSMGKEVAKEVKTVQKETIDATEVNDSKVLGIEEGGIHFALKSILKNDCKRLESSPNNSSFGGLIFKKLSADTIKIWLPINRACFVAVNILEGNKALTEDMKALVGPHIQIIEKNSTPGGLMLKSKLGF